MSEQFADFELLLKRALSPVEPPKELEARMEATLGSLVHMATEELEAWELSAMRDPRNWPRQALRPAAAVVVGSAAAVGLVAVRTQRKRHRRRAVSGSMLELAERTLRDVATEARRLADEAPGRR
jgi:hypothetical protein